MSDLVINELAVSFEQTLFSNVSLSLNSGDRVGVVGNNGSGKTTLLGCIAGKVEPSGGDIRSRKGLRTVFVEQRVPEAIKALSFDEVLVSAIAEDERDLLAWRSEIVFDSFSTPQDMRGRPLGQLSGGWQRLAMIGRAWVSDPDLLLLDEPTNHLDLSKVMLLESWMARELSRAAVVIVSHDRRFLNNCTTRTLFLRQINSRFYKYAYDRARELLSEDDRSHAKKIDRDLSEAERLKKSAHKLRQIGVDNYSASALRKSIQIGKRAESIERSIPPAQIEPKRDVRLSSRPSYSNRIIGIEDLVVSRPDGSPLFRVDRLDVNRTDRVILLGRNGTGKTQFVRRLREAFNDRETARSQGIAISHSAIVGFLAQGMSHLSSDVAIGDFIRSIGAVSHQQATAQLVSAGFPFAEHVKTIGDLSPGQSSRLALLALRLSEPTFFLMDEPTNYLDIAGQEHLEAAILDQDAAAFVVSHDRVFTERIGTRFLVIEDSTLLELKSPDPFYRSLAEDVPVSSILQ